MIRAAWDIILLYEVHGPRESQGCHSYQWQDQHQAAARQAAHTPAAKSPTAHPPPTPHPSPTTIRAWSPKSTSPHATPTTPSHFIYLLQKAFRNPLVAISSQVFAAVITRFKGMTVYRFFSISDCVNLVLLF